SSTVTVRQVVSFGDQNASSIVTSFRGTATGRSTGASAAKADVPSTDHAVRTNSVGKNRSILRINTLLEPAGSLESAPRRTEQSRAAPFTSGAIRRRPCFPKRRHPDWTPNEPRWDRLSCPSSAPDGQTNGLKTPAERRTVSGRFKSTHPLRHPLCCREQEAEIRRLGSRLTSRCSGPGPPRRLLVTKPLFPLGPSGDDGEMLPLDSPRWSLSPMPMARSNHFGTRAVPATKSVLGFDFNPTVLT